MTANRLTDLRKAHGLTQEELAEKLDVSRQAISKWERGDASPDTDNLIALANIYGVTIDELIYGENAPKWSAENGAQTYEKDGVTIVANGDEITAVCGNRKREYSRSELKARAKRFDAAWTSVCVTVSVLMSALYLLFGFLLPHGWRNWWFLFLLIPFAESIVRSIEKKKLESLNIPCLVTSAYCAVGMLFGIWHPTWIVFILIPVFYEIARTVDKRASVQSFEAVNSLVNAKSAEE